MNDTVKKLYDDKDILSIACTLQALKDVDLYEPNEVNEVNEQCNMYIRCIAHTLACMESYTIHYGDCTQAPSPCIVCMMEDMYHEAVQLLKLYDIHDVVLLMTLIQMQEAYWRVFPDTTEECPTIKECFEKYILLPLETQKIMYDKMLVVKEYAENPYKIKDIPWW